MNTRQEIEAILKKVKKMRTARPVFKNINVFAGLPTRELVKWKNKFKKILGPKLNLNDFTKACNEARGEIGVETSSDGLPSIITNSGQLREITDKALEALVEKNSPFRIFKRDDHLVRLKTVRKGGLNLEILGPAQLTGELTRAANFFRKSNSRLDPDRPPEAVVRDILSLGTWPFPYLQGITQTPLVRVDGSIIFHPGYDAETALYYHPGKGPNLKPISENPTDAEIGKARKLLRKLLRQFPFADKVHMANAFALLLTPIVRPIIRGRVPLAVIDAPTKGSMKTILANTAAFIATGVLPEPFTPPGKNEDEWRKKITSTLREGDSIIFIDDIDFILESRSLTTVLTSEVWQDRLLGVSQNISIPHQSVWMAAGNNIRVGKDLQRRCYWIRLDPKTPTPWLLTDFEIPDLWEWIKSKRGELLWSLLTIVRGWASQNEADKSEAASRPPAFGSFEAWAKIIGGILDFIEIEGFLKNLYEFTTRMDEDTLSWEPFLRAVYKMFPGKPFTAKELSQAIQQAESPLEEVLPPELDEAPMEASGAPSAARRSFERVLGKAFARMEGRRFGPKQYHIIRCGERSRAILWKVCREEGK